jgi:hypothetical protein
VEELEEDQLQVLVEEVEVEQEVTVLLFLAEQN